MDQTVNINFNISGNASEATANITNNNSGEDVFLELKEAVYEGMQSGIAEDFDPETHLKSLRQSFLTNIQIEL